MDSWSEETNPPSEDVGFYPARLNRAPKAASFLAGVLLHYIFLFGPSWSYTCYIIYFFWGVIRTATFFLQSPFFFPLLEDLLYYIPPFHWSWPSICWSCRLLLECLPHLPPSSTCYELQQTRWYCSGVISSLMRPNRQLRAFTTEVTASPRIAPPPCSHSWPTMLVLLLGRPGKLSLRVCRFLLPWPWFAKDNPSLRVCRFLLPWPWFAEDRFVLGDVS